MSADTKFTPGPWEWWTSNSWRRLFQHHTLRDPKRVLEPWKHQVDGHLDCIVSEADMALIAAAPDLYSALAELEWAGEYETDDGDCVSSCPWCEAHQVDGTHFDGCRVNAALKKARGEVV